MFLCILDPKFCLLLGEADVNNDNANSNNCREYILNEQAVVLEIVKPAIFVWYFNIKSTLAHQLINYPVTCSQKVFTDGSDDEKNNQDAKTNDSLKLFVAPK